MSKSANKGLADIYHSLNDINGNIEEIETSAGVELKKELDLLKSKLDSTKQKVLETIITDIIDEHPKEPISETQTEFGLQKATELIEAVEKKAKEWKLSVIIAVYDKAAHPIAIHCMDDAYIASFDIATNKAYTSAALKMPTSTLKKLSQPGQELYGIQHTNAGKIVIFGGGEPLVFNGKLVGAIGVSGANEEQDTKLAEYGSNMLKEVMT